MTCLQRLFVAAALLAAPQPLIAGQVDLLLEVDFDGASSTAGGSWRLVASTDENDSFGLFALRVPIEGISGSAANLLPTGRVNGSSADNAGFTIFSDVQQGAFRDLFFAQTNSPIGDDEQGIFYGVGTLVNGSPDFPDQPAGTSAIGPELTTLTDVSGVPWGLESGLTAGVQVASGAFAPGQIPAFSEIGSFEALLLTTLGTSTAPGAISNEATFTTQVINNLLTGDYNGDGIVNTADYAVYRDTLGQSVDPFSGADGDGDGLITDNDLQLWISNFGQSLPAATAVAIPEPASWLVIASLACCVASQSGRLRARN